VAAWPDYADYQTKTSRQIPVFGAHPERRRELFAILDVCAPPGHEQTSKNR
jgi:hypothetical protein